MSHSFKTGDKIKISKSQMEKEPSIKKYITSNWGLSYDKTYTIIEVYSEDLLIDVGGDEKRFYARFFVLANTKTVGFVIE